MERSAARKNRSQHLAAAFDQLCSTDQQYMDTLTAQLAIIQSRCKRQTAPEKQVSTGIKPKNKVQQNKEQEK